MTSAPKPKFVSKDVQNDGTVYEIYSGTDSESAKEFLATQKISQKNYYMVVETPDGNWGTDIQGLYLESLRVWQVNISLASCEGIAQPFSVFGMQAAARGINDNFIAKVRCGKCGHNWLDGIRYKNTTIVKCPNCKTHNKIDSSNMTVIS